MFSTCNFVARFALTFALSIRMPASILAFVLAFNVPAIAQRPGIFQLSPLVDATADTLAFPTTGTITAADIGDGVWWQPELDETSITQVLHNMNEWDIRNLYVDVFRDGETLFPSAVFPQQAAATNRDWLNYIITEAHNHNIRVHAWTQVLCWQEPDSETTLTHPLLSAHPEWLEVSDEGKVFDGESMARFVSPGVPEVQSALRSLAQEICRYPIDGLNLDAVAYNDRAETGYNPAALREFEMFYGIDPSDLRRSTNEDSEWMQWVAFREDQLTSLVQMMGDETRQAGESAGRRILFSVNVLPIYEETRGRNSAYQHWGQWVEEKLVDATIPQCFSPELPGLEKQLWQVRSVHMGAEIASIPGLLLDEDTTNSHPSLQEQQRLLKNTGFQHSNIMQYQGLLLGKQSPVETDAEKKRGFWDFLRPNRRAGL